MQFLSPFDASLGRSPQFFLWFSAQPFLGLVGEAFYPPIVSYCIQNGYHPTIFRIVWFYRVCHPTSSPFDKDQGLLSILGGYASTCCVQNILRRLWSCRRFRCQFLREMVFVLSNILGVFRSYRRVADFIRQILSGGALVRLSSLGYLCDRGLGFIWGTAFHLQEMTWEVFSLTYCYVVWQQRRSLGIYSLIFNWIYFGGRISYLFCRGGDN